MSNHTSPREKIEVDTRHPSFLPQTLLDFGGIDSKGVRYPARPRDVVKYLELERYGIDYFRSKYPHNGISSLSPERQVGEEELFRGRLAREFGEAATSSTIEEVPVERAA